MGEKFKFFIPLGIRIENDPKDVRALQIPTSLVHQTFSLGSICPPHVKSKIKLYGHPSYYGMTTGQSYKRFDRNNDSFSDIDTFSREWNPVFLHD